MTSQITESIIPVTQQQVKGTFKKEDKAKFDEFLKYLLEETKTFFI